MPIANSQDLQIVSNGTDLLEERQLTERHDSGWQAHHIF